VDANPALTLEDLDVTRAWFSLSFMSFMEQVIGAESGQHFFTSPCKSGCCIPSKIVSCCHCLRCLCRCEFTVSIVKKSSWHKANALFKPCALCGSLGAVWCTRLYPSSTSQGNQQKASSICQVRSYDRCFKWKLHNL
jgi:hypothetical protein